MSNVLHVFSVHSVEIHTWSENLPNAVFSIQPRDLDHDPFAHPHTYLDKVTTFRVNWIRNSVTKSANECTNELTTGSIFADSAN